MRDAATRTGINEATLYRVETARTRPQRRTLLTLLDLYEVADPLRTDLLAVIRDAGKQGWLRSNHAELPDGYAASMSFEAEARSVRDYQSLLISGLLQTEDYARAVIRSTLPMASVEDVEQRVRVRMERQALLAASDPLRIWAIMDEAALRRVVGGPKVMRAQARHLIEMAEQPHVTLQVIPFEQGAHPGMLESFLLMDFPDAQDPELVYIETMAGGLFLESEVDVRRYRAMFEHLTAAAVNPDASTEMIAAVAMQ